jgi:hypothetical protein
MFSLIEDGSTSRRAGSNRSNEPQKKWNFIKSITVFGAAVYFIRDLASNDLLPIE